MKKGALMAKLRLTPQWLSLPSIFLANVQGMGDCAFIFKLGAQTFYLSREFTSTVVTAACIRKLMLNLQ